MKKTLALSMFGAMAFALPTGCTDKDQDPGDTAVSVGDEVDTDADTDATGETGESSSDGTDDDGSTSTGLEETTGFIMTPDGGPVESTCDPFMQDCPEGEKCVPWGSSGAEWDANKCVMVTGSGQPGDVCTWGGIVEATDDCGADSICWDVMDVDGQLIGVCTPFCGGTADAPICEPGTSCIIANDGSVTLCLKTCDPLLQDCGAGLACFYAVSDFNCIFTTQDIPTGEPCGYINDCAAGNYCADAAALPACNGSACCASFCDFSDPNAMCPTAGTECVSFFEEGMAPPGYEDVGVCILPA
jgi:hypothetical protein